MRVTVDETGNDDFAGSVHNLARRVFAVDFGSLADFDDPAVLNGDRTLLDHSMRAVHRDNRPAFDDDVHGSLPPLRHHFRRREKYQCEKNESCEFHCCLRNLASNARGSNSRMSTSALWPLKFASVILASLQYSQMICRQVPQG